MSNILVTGGAGFIGANFVHYWLRKYPGDRVVVLDSLTYAGNLASLVVIMDEPAFRFVRGDICDAELVSGLLKQEQIDTIVHFAAESHVDRSISDPGEFIHTNIVGTYTLLEAARGYWLDDGGPTRHRFHHVSTDEVYGSLGPGDPAFSEQTAYAPNSPYSASKASSDHLVRAYYHTYGLQVSTSNCSNNYGPYQFPEKLIPLMIVNALAGKQLPVYGDGSNIRDWLYVEDHVRGIDLVIRKGEVGETYNIGGNEEHANLDIVRALCSCIDDVFANDDELAKRFPLAPATSGEPTSSLITMVRDRPGHDWRYAIDASRMRNDLFFEPTYNFASGLRSAVDWMLANEDWWRAILDESYRDWIEDNYVNR